MPYCQLPPSRCDAKLVLFFRAYQLRELSWSGVPSIYQPLVWKLLSVCSSLRQLLYSAVPDAFDLLYTSIYYLSFLLLCFAFPRSIPSVR